MNEKTVPAPCGQPSGLIAETVGQDGSRLRMSLTALIPPTVKIEFIRPDGTIAYELEGVYVGKDGQL